MLSKRPDITQTVEHGEVSYKQKYRELKRRLKYLVYENECFEKDIRVSQLKLLHINREKSFLLDQLMIHETLVLSDNSDIDSTDYSSEDEKSSAYSEMLSRKTNNSQVSGPITSSPKQTSTKTPKGSAKKTNSRFNKASNKATKTISTKSTVTSTTKPTLIVSLPLSMGQTQQQLQQCPPKLIPTVSTRAIGHDRKPSAIGAKGKRPIVSSSSGSSSSSSDSSNSDSGSSDSSDSENNNEQMDTNTIPPPPPLLAVDSTVAACPKSQSPIRIMPPSTLTSLSTIPRLSPSNPSPTITTKLLTSGSVQPARIVSTSKSPSLVATIGGNPINIGAFHNVKPVDDTNMTLNNR